MSAERMAVLFNEWMRRFIADPVQFSHEFQQVQDFLTDTAKGVVPSYGESCAAYMQKLDAEVGAALPSSAII